MARIKHSEEVALPASFDWDAIIKVESFFEERQSERGPARRRVYVTGEGFTFHEDASVAEALGAVGDRRSEVNVLSIEIVAFEEPQLQLKLEVYLQAEWLCRFKVGGPDEVEVHGIARTFRQRFLVESKRGVAWRQPPAPEAPSPSLTPATTSSGLQGRWKYLSTHPLYSAVIAGLAVVAVVSFVIWIA